VSSIGERVYPGVCRHGIDAGAAARKRHALRVRVDASPIEFTDRLYGAQQQRLSVDVGDCVLRRSDGLYAYQLAVVVDDAAQGITDVVRGADLLDSTPRQILLQRMLGLPRTRYAHLPLALDHEGRKLSKQDRALAVDANDPLPSLRAALQFLGQSVPTARHPAVLLSQAARDFDEKRIARVGAAPAPNAAVRKEVC
jgi:glutamyl-Q tRNA(Asp) synthetase